MNTGGPAFPGATYDGPFAGMSLRDYFAAKAMASLGFTTKPYDTTAETAKKCYQMADAMLKAREA
jgi:hypothetical protein